MSVRPMTLHSIEEGGWILKSSHVRPSGEVIRYFCDGRGLNLRYENGVAVTYKPRDRSYGRATVASQLDLSASGEIHEPNRFQLSILWKQSGTVRTDGSYLYFLKSDPNVRLRYKDGVGQIYDRVVSKSEGAKLRHATRRKLVGKTTDTDDTDVNRLLETVVSPALNVGI